MRKYINIYFCNKEKKWTEITIHKTRPKIVLADNCSTLNCYKRSILELKV